MNKSSRIPFRAITLLSLLILAPIGDAAGTNEALIDWQSWTAEIFPRAERENRLVLLNLEAVWCHWCHVMDQKTYADENVASILGEHYISVKVDHDARPDLANRYRNYGWPATIVFSADGREIIKRAGYIAPERMAHLLLAIVDDPSLERAALAAEPEQYAENPLLSKKLFDELVARHERTFDPVLGGYKSAKKIMDRDTTEYDIVRAAIGNQAAEKMARLTIENSLALIDPAWGGAYQYSTHGRWDYPHYEKVMVVQAGFLRIYSLAYLQWRDPRYLQAALDMERFLADFLTSPDGAYYTSQDADLVQGVKGTEYFGLPDAERRALGIPRIDTNIYARENGWAIEAVATLYQATGNTQFLSKARTAAEWIIENRSLPGGGFRHGESTDDGPYLADTLNMGRAFLQLYAVSGDRLWLERAASAGRFIDETFRHGEAGFLSGADRGGPVGPVANIDENVSVTRFLNLLAHYLGKPEFRKAAEFAMRYLATEDVATQRIEEGGILLAALEMTEDPAHFTVVGPKSDLPAADLFAVAVSEPGWYKRIEWWDKAEGPLPNPDVRYPSFPKAAGYVCTNGRCSVPAFEVDRYRSLIASIARQQSEE